MKGVVRVGETIPPGNGDGIIAASPIQVSNRGSVRLM